MLLEVETARLSPGVAIWHRYDPAVKAELFSTSLATSSGLYLIDPIPLKALVLQSFVGAKSLAGIVITNGNHARGAAEMSRRLGLSIHAHPDAKVDLADARVTELSDGWKIAEGFKAVTIEGAAPGEIALHCSTDGGTLILGDAVINMGSHGFTFLPTKYCTDPKLMRRSLRKLLAYSFTRMLFAHGTPIVSDAQLRLSELLSGSSNPE